MWTVFNLLFRLVKCSKVSARNLTYNSRFQCVKDEQHSCAVLTVITLTIDSWPGWTPCMPPSFHFNGGKLVSLSTTRLQDWSSLFPACRVTVKKSSIRCVVASKILVPWSWFHSSNRFVCRSRNEGCPIKKWAGVSGSTVRLLSCASGRMLRIASICGSTFENFLKDRAAPPITRSRCIFIERTPDCHKPPKRGVEGGIKCHFQLLAEKRSSNYDRWRLLGASPRWLGTPSCRTRRKAHV